MLLTPVPPDLQVYNVCEYLNDIPGILQVPQEGLMIVVSDDFGVYGWAKNFLGKFFVGHPDPFDGRVDSIAKLEARLVEHDIVQPLLNKLSTQTPPVTLGPPLHSLP